MLGLPPCSGQGCPWPGIFKIEFIDTIGEVTAYVCPFCFIKLPKLLNEMFEVRQERKLLMHDKEHVDEHRN
jgi:hypothetical protein